MEQLIHINLVIADRPYPLKIKPAEEEMVRKAAKVINDKVKEFQNLYAAKDKQDYLAMTALMFTVEALSGKDKTEAPDTELEEKLGLLQQVLNQGLAI